METPSINDNFSSRTARIKVKKAINLRQKIYNPVAVPFLYLKRFRNGKQKTERCHFQIQQNHQGFFFQHLYLSFLDLKRSDFDRFMCFSKGSEKQSSLADM